MIKILLNNLKKITIFLSIILLMVIFYFLNKYASEEYYYYSNYFDHNKKELILIKDYIDKNKLKGSYDTTFEYYTGSLYVSCFKGEICNLSNGITIQNMMKKLNIDSIRAYDSWFPGDLFIYGKNIGTFGIEFALDKLNKRATSMFVYYSPGFFNGKKEGDRIDPDGIQSISEIYNSDWGLVYGYYYGCN